MISKDVVVQIVESYLADTNYYLVDLRVSSDNCVSVEVDSFDGVNIDFCAELNKHIDSHFDRDVDDFELEVSSAGLTEPFKVTKQYEKNIGNDVEVLAKTGLKYVGVLTDVTDADFTIEIEKAVKPEGAKRKMIVSEKLTFVYQDIKTTKYIIRFK